ncbi:SHS1 (YDL225W) [Zygosaccharomyces parabailii]|nr:SHS1 (YDL225W) [Zygosaccharomyces parabailii]CDH13439.1 probable Seventh homolog of septin 1 [Zygosaccharomyces bailii ISA1307]
MNPAPPPHLFRKKKEHRRGITYSMLLCGPSGTGKTTFANNLLESSIFPHRYEQTEAYDISPKIRITSPTKVVSFNSSNGIPSYMASFDPARAKWEPGVTITSTSVEIGTGQPSADAEYEDEEEIILFNLVNTHGIGENIDDSLCFDEVTLYLEQQFDTVLAEETRIKRNPRFEDTRVHIALYFIEPTGHGLREMDVEFMKRISRYTNVLPIISRADSFTKEELNEFRQKINSDLEKYHVPVYKFEVDPEDDDIETIEENQALANLQPFAIICSDTKDTEGRYVREYPWGAVIINDSKTSDLHILKSVLFGSHLQEFKDTTQNLLYENYRAEKLSTVSEQEASGSGTNASAARQSAAPSLSNFASLIRTGQIKSSQSLAIGPEAPSTPETKSSARQSSSRNPSQDSDEKLPRQDANESGSGSESPERSKLRNISETVPYVLRHERILARQQKLEKLEAQSAKELQMRIQELERKAHDLKQREKLLRQQQLEGSNLSFDSSSASVSYVQNHIKKEDTYTDLASIASNRN